MHAFLKWEWHIYICTNEPFRPISSNPNLPIPNPSFELLRGSTTSNKYITEFLSITWCVTFVEISQISWEGNSKIVHHFLGKLTHHFLDLSTILKGNARFKVTCTGKRSSNPRWNSGVEHGRLKNMCLREKNIHNKGSRKRATLMKHIESYQNISKPCKLV